MLDSKGSFMAVVCLWDRKKVQFKQAACVFKGFIFIRHEVYANISCLHVRSISLHVP